VPGAELAAPREKELNDQLQALQDKRRGIEAEKQALSLKQKFFDTLSNQGALRSQENIAEINLKPEQWAGAAQAVYNGIAEVLKGQITQDAALREVDHQIRKVQQELNQLRTGQRSVYEVALPVESSGATKLTVELTYQIPEATWSPVYDARLDTKTGALELVQYGSVRQNSGEDWGGVALTLSTAQPNRGTGLPELYTMWVNLYQAVVQNMAVMGGAMREDARMARKAMAPAASMEVLGMDMASAPLEEDKVASFATAVIDTGGFVSEYKIPGPSTVKADGTESKLMIGNFDTENELMIEIKPQMSTEAYLVSHAKLKGEAPILAGPVSLFRDGAFVGQSHLTLLRPDQETDLAFGVDDQVSVRRNVLKDERSEAGVIARDNILERHFVTEVQNLHKDKVKVVVLETMPVAQDKQIGVEILKDMTTPGYKEDLKNIKGLLRWEMPLEPKQKSELKLGWKVSWPKDQQINGL
jgi:uncharacterized protein (TIGR02231 family)